jgi:hypothetical protein
VVDLAKEWRTRVRVLRTDHTAKGREEANRFLELLRAGCIFCRVATGEEDALGGLDKEYRELVHEVKVQEANYQGKQNTELVLNFSQLQGKFRDALFNDLEINEAASGSAVGSSRLQFIWSHAPLIFSREFLEKFVSHCKEGRDILAWFGHVENIAKERREQCVNRCVQLPFVPYCFKEQLLHEIETGISVCDESIRMCELVLMLLAVNQLVDTHFPYQF